MAKRKTNTTTFFSLIILLLILITSCATVKVPIPVTHPAEINMSQYKQVAISEIEGNLGRRFADTLKNRLIESGRFKVVDRNRMSRIMSELQLSQSDLADSEKAVKLGKLISASALIAGHMNGNYKEERTSSTGTCYSVKEKEKYPCTRHYRKGRYSTNGSIDVIDVQTGEIIISKFLNADRVTSTSASENTPPPINSDALAREAFTENINTFMRAITPWSELVQVPFITDDSIPDLERGINHAKIGELKEAIRIFKSAAEAAEESDRIDAGTIAKAYWNLGLAYQYSGAYDNAVAAFKKAYIMSPEDEYVAEIKNARRLKAEKVALDEQNN